MTAAVILAVQFFGVLGYGAIVLRMLGLFGNTGHVLRLALAFAFGQGVLGWLVFYAGVLGGFTLIPLFLITIAGAPVWFWLALRPQVTSTNAEPADEPPGLATWALIALLFLVFAFDIAEAMAPPADGDSLAYHLALLKEWQSAGRILFVPRAVDGAAPLLVQASYAPAFVAGGERAATLWLMVSGWMPGLLIYALARPYTGRDISLTGALLFITAPAMIYGGGTGMVESRIALFTLAAVWALGTCVRADGGAVVRGAMAAGLAAGFYAASKYTGLLFVAAVGIAIVFRARRHWFVAGLAFAIAVLVAAHQWYAWNFIHAGDPVFPLLFDILGGNGYWDAEHAAAFRNEAMPSERGVPPSFWWLFLYPIATIVAPVQEFQSVRTGLGPFALIVLPFAVIGAWHHRSRLMQSRLFAGACVAAIFYAAWFLGGAPQRVRHLLPVYSVVFIILLIAAARGAQAVRANKILIAALGLILLIQMGGAAFYARNSLRFAIGGQTRDAFLQDNVVAYDAAQQINRLLGPDNRVLLFERQILYYLDVPYLLADPYYQSLVNVLPDARDVNQFVAELRAQNIDHVYVPAVTQIENSSGLTYLAQAALNAGCLEMASTLPAVRFQSRTLAALPRVTTLGALLKVRDGWCL